MTLPPTDPPRGKILVLPSAIDRMGEPERSRAAASPAVEPEPPPPTGEVVIASRGAQARPARAVDKVPANDGTLVVQLFDDQDRDLALNGRTVCIEPARPRLVFVKAPTSAEVRASFKELFVHHYRAIAGACTSFGEPGVAVVAFDALRRRLVGSLYLRARPDGANVAIIGRHGCAELYLDVDPTVSLRHLALVTHPLQAGEDLGFRLLDLRTSCAFADEHGRKLEALVAEGPVFVSCGRYALFLFTTGDGLPWPDDAEDGWACIPERVYLSESDAEPDRWRRHARRDRQAASGMCGNHAGGNHVGGNITLVGAIRGPSRAGRSLLAAGERPLGRLRVRTAEGDAVMELGARAADEGVLFGRYDRCDGDGPARLDDYRISRVHLLVLRIGERLYAIDTASTNGTFAAARGRPADPEGSPNRITLLEADRAVVLGNDLARVSWEPG